jgi:hypothetical protein
MPPLLWRARTQRVERSEKRSSGQIPSPKASRSLILVIGRTAKCTFLVYRCLAQRGWSATASVPLRFVEPNRFTQKTISSFNTTPPRTPVTRTRAGYLRK